MIAPPHTGTGATLLATLLLAAAGAGASATTVEGDDGASAERAMVLTFDDLPYQGPSATFVPADRGDLASLEAMNRDLVAALRSARVPAVGFVNEIKLEADGGRVDPARAALLEIWLEAGFELGNHTRSHPDLHRVSLAEFKEEILAGEVTTRRLARRHGMPEPRWFRHPFLHSGRDLETKEALGEFLTEHGYEIAPVTIDNSEWIFAKAYALALADDEGRAAKVRAEYLDYMLAKTVYYERQSLDLLDREIPQVLLLHANRLNADSVAELIERHRERGYRFVDLETALEDQAYRREDEYTGPAGISWLQRWAIAEGRERSFFAGEPRTPQWILELAQVDSE